MGEIYKIIIFQFENIFKMFFNCLCYTVFNTNMLVFDSSLSSTRHKNAGELTHGLVKVHVVTL